MELSVRRLQTSADLACLQAYTAYTAHVGRVLISFASEPLHYLAVPFTKKCVSECVHACTQMGQSLYTVIKYRSDRRRLMYYTVQLQLCVCVHSERCNRIHGSKQPYELTK